MMTLNRVTLIGHLGREPEIRRTQSGDPVVHLSVATSESWKDKTSGERKEKTEWHRVVVYDPRLCELVSDRLKKGSGVFLEGKLQTRKWTDKDGQEKYTTEIVLPRYQGQIILLDGTPKAESERFEGSIRKGGGPAALDDEIPFAPDR